MPPPRANNPSLAQAFDGLRSDYSAAKASRFQRRRVVPAMGSHADYHYQSDADFLRVMEYARDMDRNDMLAGMLVDRAVSNTVQDGILLDPETGDRELDAELRARWMAWCEDPDACDLGGELSWWQIERAALRAMLVDGDIFGVAGDDGRLAMLEAHRVRTPSKAADPVVHGILLERGTRRHLQAWVAREDLRASEKLQSVEDVTRVDIRDADGYRQVFHVRNPKRVSQTRGVSAFAPVFDGLGMHEDIQFARLVQQQVVSCFAVFHQRDQDSFVSGGGHGEQEYETLGDGSTRTIEGIAPGLELHGAPGERLEGFSPNVPNPQFFDHVNLVLRLICSNLGLPLQVLLLDASQTNFSGWRGALDQARRGWMDNQRQLVRQWHRPIYTWQLRLWIATDPALRAYAARVGGAIWNHRWNYPQWPYVEPLKDAQADALKIEKNLTSPRRLHAERGRDYDEVLEEIVEDRARLIRAAIDAADGINGDYPEAGVTWREIAGAAPVGGAPSGQVVQPDEEPDGEADGDGPVEDPARDAEDGDEG